MPSNRLRDFVDGFKATPLHPQWLLRSQRSMVVELRAINFGRVLDIGCADRWVQGLLQANCEYIGLDYPETGLKLYRARPEVFADASCLPIGSQTIDTVIAFEVIEHLRQPHEALREVARVLRPKGRLLLTVPFLYPIHDAPHDFQRYTVHGLIREMEDVGLQVDEIKPSLGSAESGGLLFNLAIGGMVMQAVQQRSLAVALSPLLVAVIPVVNLLAWLLGQLLPSWPAVTAGYQLTARRP